MFSTFGGGGGGGREVIPSVHRGISKYIGHVQCISLRKKWWYLRFPLWKPAPGNNGPSCMRVKESNAKVVDRMQKSLIECSLVIYC